MAERKCVTEPAVAARLTNRWLFLGLLLVIALLNYADRYLLAGLAEPVRAEFALSDSFMGLLLGPAFALLYCILAIPIARLADRASRILIICLGCAIWSGFTILSGLAETPVMLALARVGVGVGEAAYQAPGAALVAAYFPIAQRGRAFAILGSAIYFGQMLGLVGGPAIAAAHGWRTAFEVIGACGLIIAACSFLIIREPPRAPLAAAPAHEPLVALFARLWARPSFRRMTLGMAMGTLSGVSFGMWGPALFERVHAVPTEQASASFGLAFGLPGLGGMLIFGFVADRFARHGPGWLLGFSGAALTLATALILAVTWAPDLSSAQWLAIPSGLLGGGWSIGIIAGLQYVLPERIRVSGTALALLVIGLAGNVIGPLAAGQLSDLFAGSPAQSLQFGLSVIIPSGFLGGWLLWTSGRSIAADRDHLLRGGIDS